MSALNVVKVLGKVLDFVSSPIIIPFEKRSKSSSESNNSRRQSAISAFSHQSSNNQSTIDDHIDETIPIVVQEDSNDPYSSWVRTGSPSKSYLDGCHTLDMLTWKVICRYGDKEVLGYRKILKKVKSKNPSSGTFNGSPYSYDDYDLVLENSYTWIRMSDAHALAISLMKGFLRLGIEQQDKVVIYLEPRYERFIVVQAILRIGATAIMISCERSFNSSVHAINESEAGFLVTSSNLLSKVSKMTSSLNQIQDIIVVTDVVAGKPEKLSESSIHGIKMWTVDDITEYGRNYEEMDLPEWNPSDAAFLVYTSGSTGIPKAVVWSYQSVLNAITHLSTILETLDIPNNASCLMTPIPLTMDIMYCTIFACIGVKIAYQTNFNLIMPSSKNEVRKLNSVAYDLEALHPEIILGTPLTLNNLCRLFEESPIIRLKSLVNYYNSIKHRDSYIDWPSSPDKFTLKQRLIGDKLQYVVCGGAPLSDETVNYLIERLCVKNVVRMYGSAESCSGMVINLDNKCLGSCGYPTYGTKIRLIDWKEGGYLVTDKPNPRGEVVIGTYSASDGYYKNPLQTQQTFFTDSDGLRWVVTGDIGEIFPDGSLRLIDRKRDLFKLSCGEFLSPAKIESVLRGCPVVENICIYGEPTQNFVVGLVRPHKETILQMASVLNKQDTTFPFLCYDQEIIHQVHEQIKSHAAKCLLHPLEIPKYIRLFSHPWTPASGLVTGSLKIRRHHIKRFYQNDIRMLFN